MKELIKVTTNEEGKRLVSARELHEFLGINTRYNDWFKRMCGYGFEENSDFTPLTQKRVTAQGNEVTQLDHIITIDMAKEISMIQRTDKGKEARKYFIECEKKLKGISNNLETQKGLALLKVAEGNTLEERISGATKYAELVSKPLADKIEKDKPKVNYYEKVLNTEGTMTTSQVAKGFNMTAQKLNNYLHDKKVQFKRSGMWMLYKEYDGQGYTDVKTSVIKKGLDNITTHYLVWTEKGRRFIYDLLLEDKLI